MVKNVSVGDQLTVLQEINGHQFPIGSIVTAVKVKPEFILCENNTGDQYGLTPEELGKGQLVNG